MIFDRLGEIHDNKLGCSKAEIAEELDKINDKRKDYMLSAEKKCRRLKSGRIPFPLKPLFGSEGAKSIVPCLDFMLVRLEIEAT